MKRFKNKKRGENMIVFDEPLTLDAWLKIRGLSNGEFAKLIGVKEPTVWNWKRGSNLPHSATIPKIEEVLDTDYKNIKFSSKEL